MFEYSIPSHTSTGPQLHTQAMPSKGGELTRAWCPLVPQLKHFESIILNHTCSTYFFPTCQVRVVRFYVRCAAPRTSSPSSSILLPPSSPSRPSSSFLVLPPPRWISFASSWSQWASPDFICQLLIAVSLAGSHLPALDRSGARRTSTSEGLSAVGLAGLQPARVGALWASPNFNRRDLARRGPCRTLTGPQRPETKPNRMPKRMPDRMPENWPDRMSEDLPGRMPDSNAR